MKRALLAFPLLFLAACANQKADQNFSAEGGPASYGGRSQATSGSRSSGSSRGSLEASQSRSGQYSSSGGGSASSQGGSRPASKNGMSASGNQSASSDAEGISKGGSSSRSSQVAATSERSGGGDVPSAPKPAAQKVSIVGTWSGVSNGEKIVLKVGNGGSASLTNSGGANSGEWAAGGSSGRFAFTFGGRRGDFVLLDSRTATLTVMGSTIELRR